jgi:hypothetical protein
VGWEGRLIAGWHIPHPWHYGFVVLGLTVVARGLIAVVRALKPWPVRRRCFPTWKEFFCFPAWKAFVIACGCRWWRHFVIAPDFDLDPSIVGTLELIAYPILMRAGAWTVIGAWLAFKTAAQWDAWKQGRAAYNQFLIGNALVLGASFFFLLPMVKP